MVQRAALIGLLALASCTSSSDDPGSDYLARAALEEEPASRLSIPGAEIIRRVGGERFQNVTGPEPSFTGAIYGVQSPVTGVIDFYDRELAALGWEHDHDPILSSGEHLVKGWCKPRMTFRLGIFDPRRYERVGIEDGERFTTIFDARITASRLPCPYVPPPMPTP